MCSVVTGNKLIRNTAKSRAASAVLAVALALGTGVATASTAGAPAGEWQYEFTPYLWGAAMKGDVQGGALPKISVDASFSDITKVLDFGLMGAFEARKGQWGLVFDAIYMDLSTDGTASRTGPGPIGATATANASFGMKQTVVAAALAYRASVVPPGWRMDRSSILDAQRRLLLEFLPVGEELRFARREPGTRRALLRV